MDEVTQKLLDDFVNFLTREIKKNKKLHAYQIGKWSLKDFRVTVEVFVNESNQKIFFDLREIKDNRDRFGHLLNYALEQLNMLIH